MRRGYAFLIPLAIFILGHAFVQRLEACGHNSFYLGAGYTQLFMYTPQNQRGNTNENVTFGPGFGVNALVGYDFCNSRWGIQMPFEFTRQRLNRFEWVSQVGSSVEGVLHLAEWQSGLDIHLVGGAGWTYISEGKVRDNTAAKGITASLGPGLSYYFSRTDKVSAAVVFEVPFKLIHYFGTHLSSGGTTLIAFPMRVSMQVGF